MTFEGSRESIQAVVNEGGVQSLVKHLTSSNEKVLETVTRSLKIIYESKIPPRDYMFKVECGQPSVDSVGKYN